MKGRGGKPTHLLAGMGGANVVFGSLLFATKTVVGATCWKQKTQGHADGQHPTNWRERANQSASLKLS